MENIPNSIEEIFVNTFVRREFREQWHTRLSISRTRQKLIHRLAHTAVEEFMPQYIFNKDDPPSEIEARVTQVLTTWKRVRPKQLCYIIAVRDARDRTWMQLSETEGDYELTFGAIIIIIPDRLAYYHTERSNINKQPFYILFK